MLKKFTPLVFLASLGAGGISVIPFALLQYSMPDLEGLVKIADLNHGSNPFTLELYYYSLEAIMIVFSLLHIAMSIRITKSFLKWIKTPAFKETINNPLANAGLMAPFISLTMLMNVFIGPIRFFIPSFAANLQNLMLPALIFWIALWIAIMATSLKLLRISFSKGFDVSKISFGWLLHPFALGMLTVVGTGIAAMAQNRGISDTAIFLAMISGSMGMFLLLVKLVVIFKSHFAAEGLPGKQFLPSFLIVVPNITLYALSFFRLSHYMHKYYGFHMESSMFLTVMLPFAFEIWYLVFGIGLLRDYFKKDFFSKDFHITQWGFVCPVVAFSVLGTFAYQQFSNNTIIYVLNVASMWVSVILFFHLLRKHKQYLCVKPGDNQEASTNN